MSQKVHPKIQVESKKDIVFLINEFKTFANRSLESQKDEILKRAKSQKVDPAVIETEAKLKIERVINTD